MNKELKSIKELAYASSVVLFFASSVAYAVPADDVVCGRCVDTNDIAVGAITRGRLAYNAINTPRIAPNAVTSGRIMDGQVKTQDIADQAVTEAKLDQALQLKIDETAFFTNDNSSRISDLETFTKTGSFIASPTSCVRGIGDGGDPHANTGVNNPPFNSYGPSFRETSNINGTFNWFCSVPIQVPPEATLTLTGATFAYYESSSSGSTCLVGAQIKTKTFASVSIGLQISEVYSGSDAFDYATVSANSLPSTKTFPTFSEVINSDTIVFVNVVIKNISDTGGDCRYLGVMFDYTVSQ